jgi:hypothetical protein
VSFATPEASLSPICDWLESVAFTDFFACFDPLHIHYEKWVRGRESLPPHLHAPVDLFLLGRAVEPAQFPVCMQDNITGLIASGIGAQTASGAITLNDLVLLPVFGFWLLCQRPQPNPTLYFGDDSVALAMRLRRHGTHALDLCSGPGVQALRLASLGSFVVAVEVNPVAAELGRINAAINGLSDHIEIRVGNLYGAVQCEKFDVVTANPPLLPIPDELPYPFVGHGGPDGLRVVRQILDGLPTVLSDRGVCRLLGATFSDGLLPLCWHELGEWAQRSQMDLTMTVSSHHSLAPGTTFFEGLADTMVATGRTSLNEARSIFAKHIKTAEASHLCAYFLHIIRGQGEAHVIDVSRDAPSDFWFE